MFCEVCGDKIYELWLKVDGKCYHSECYADKYLHGATFGEQFSNQLGRHEKVRLGQLRMQSAFQHWQFWNSRRRPLADMNFWQSNEWDNVVKIVEDNKGG